MRSNLVAICFGLLCLSASAADAGGRSFKIEPGSILSPSYRPPPRRHHADPVYVSPPLTAFDRNMVPAANAKPSSDDYDLSERISFGKPVTKQKR